MKSETVMQLQKAKKFHDLHYGKQMLILPNVWDCLGAILLESLQYPAVATASASIAFTNGYDDGEKIPFDDLLRILKNMVKSVQVPVTADIETGYSNSDAQLEQNIGLLLDAGIVGINIEDADPHTKAIYPIAFQCERIKLIKRVASEKAIPLFINARTDVLIRGTHFPTPESRFQDALVRGAAYKEAGADCFYPLGMTDSDQITETVKQLQMPVNIISIPGIPGLAELQQMGVARLSLGPSFLKIAIKGMKNLALKLQQHDGLSDITGNEITSEYLKNLVNRRPGIDLH